MPTGQAKKRFRIPRFAWISAALLAFAILFLMMVEDRVSGPTGEPISQYKFEQLLRDDRIAHAVIQYGAENSALTQITGTYYRLNNGESVEVPFHTQVRLAGGLERELLNLPQIEAHEPNRMLMSILFGILPILLIAVLIWFFFIRQIKKASKGNLTVEQVLKRVDEQQNRYGAIMDRWEAQLQRMDGILDKLDRRADQ